MPMSNRFPALFYECDRLVKMSNGRNYERGSQLGRLASSVVETRNSLHCYFRLVCGRVLPSTWTSAEANSEQDWRSAIGTQH